MHTHGLRKKRVLFVCTGASCRSQMAAGWARHFAGEQLEAFAAGTAPKGKNPRAVAIMGEAGIDISSSPSESVEAFQGEDGPDIVITVCDEAGQRCPAFASGVPVLRWSFEDPAAIEGSEAQIETGFRRIRDEIRARVQLWVVAEFGVVPTLSRSSERTT